jgi:hypothetical protein
MLSYNQRVKREISSLTPLLTSGGLNDMIVKKLRLGSLEVRHLSVVYRRMKGSRDGKGKEMLPKKAAAHPLFSGLQANSPLTVIK